MPELLNAGKSGLGWSWTSNVLQCPQRAAYIAAGYVGDNRDALIKGSLFHIGVAHHNVRKQSRQAGEDPERHHEPAAAIRELANLEGWGFVDLAQRTMQQYEATFALTTERVLAVEHEVEMAIVGPVTGKTYRHTARMDLLYQDYADRVWIRDTKTGFHLNKTKREGFALSGQVIGLTWWGQREYGRRFGGVEIDFVRWERAATGNRKAEPTQIERFRPEPMPYAIAKFPGTIEWAREAWALAQSMYGERVADYPMTMQEQGPCMDRYGACEFRKFCKFGPGRNAP